MTPTPRPLHESIPYQLHRLVALLDRGADKILQTHLGIAYNRGLFLVVLEEHGPLTQHELAVRLGYTDPAVSTMLLELVKDDLITIQVNPEHKRKRIVALSPKGAETVTAAR